MDPKILAKVQLANYKNIITKVSNGQTLTTSEQKFIENYNKQEVTEETEAKLNVTKTAEKIGVNRQYIYEHLKKEGRTISEFETATELEDYLIKTVKKLSDVNLSKDEINEIIDYTDKSEEEMLEIAVKEAWTIRGMTTAVVQRAIRSNKSKDILEANKVWAEVNKTAAATVKELKDLQQRIGSTIELDQLFTILSDTLNRLIEQIAQLGDSAAQEANPENPEKAKAAINKYVDVLLKRIQTLDKKFELDIIQATAHTADAETEQATETINDIKNNDKK